MEKANLVKIAHNEKIQIEAAGNDLVPRIQAAEFDKNLVVEDDIEKGAVHPCNLPLYSMKPSLRNLFRKKLTRERVVPIMSASVF